MYLDYNLVAKRRDPCLKKWKENSVGAIMQHSLVVTFKSMRSHAMWKHFLYSGIIQGSEMKVSFQLGSCLATLVWPSYACQYVVQIHVYQYQYNNYCIMQVLQYHTANCYPQWTWSNCCEMTSISIEWNLQTWAWSFRSPVCTGLVWQYHSYWSLCWSSEIYFLNTICF